jgi:hypothetical protein
LVSPDKRLESLEPTGASLLDEFVVGFDDQWVPRERACLAWDSGRRPRVTPAAS